MYEINSDKRYNVNICKSAMYLQTRESFENAQLIAVECNFVAIKDEHGKEHIFTGEAIGIYINEV